MLRLGYTDYFAQGGDWGSAVTTAIGLQNRGNCAGIHVNMPNARAPRAVRENPSEQDQHALSRSQFYQQWDSGLFQAAKYPPANAGLWSG